MFRYSTQLRRARVLAQVSGTSFQCVFERSSDSTFDTWIEIAFSQQTKPGPCISIPFNWAMKTTFFYREYHCSWDVIRNTYYAECRKF